MPATHPIDEEMIRALVHGFYARVRQDAAIGPIFNDAIGEAWDAHLAKLCDFWSSVMLHTGRFQGRPMATHMRLKGVQPEHFERWLTLFRQTAREICPAESADCSLTGPRPSPAVFRWECSIASAAWAHDHDALGGGIGYGQLGGGRRHFGRDRTSQPGR